MTWDITLPPNTESERTGDDRIREFAGDVQTALQVESIFPGPNPLTAPICIAAILYGTTAARPVAAAATTGRWYYNSTTKTIQRDNGATFDDLTTPKGLMPAGAVTAFYLASAPTGWAQLTDSDADMADRALRVTSGTGGSKGGADSIISPPTHSHGAVTGSVTIPHAHPNVSNSYGADTEARVLTALYSSTCASTTNTDDMEIYLGSPTPSYHSHSITAVVGFSPSYADIILAVKT